MKSFINKIMKIVVFAFLFSVVPLALSKLLSLIYIDLPQSVIQFFSAFIFLLLYLFKNKIRFMITIKNKWAYIFCLFVIYFILVNLILIIINNA